MGGYGATRIGMKHSDVFGSLYIMSPCCLSPRPAVNPEIAKSLEAVKTPADSASLQFFARATLASAAAWSPDPKNPPLYLDLPTKDGAPQPDVLAKWAANAPLAFMDQYIGGFRRYRAISIDVGDQDGLRGRYRKASRGAGQLWDREQLRSLFRHAHKRSSRPLSESRHAVLQQKSLLSSDLPVTYVAGSISLL